MVVITTNNLEKLKWELPALLRPKRFDRIFEFPFMAKETASNIVVQFYRPYDESSNTQEAAKKKVDSIIRSDLKEEKISGAELTAFFERYGSLNDACHDFSDGSMMEEWERNQIESSASCPAL